MRTITQAVREILLSSDVAQEALSLQILNLSAYAKHIQPEVEKLTWKEVKPGTITVALFRLQSEFGKLSLLRPQVKIDTLSIQTDLVDLSFEKTEVLLSRIPTLHTTLLHTPRTVFVQTVGMHEVTYIASRGLQDGIISHLGQPVKCIHENLVGISMGFDDSYLLVPNTIYTLISSVASKRINIIEIVSTLTELMVVVDQKDREACVKALEPHFQPTS
ncbi:hypothetical protein KBD71_04700 [Candidatus Woesebacteria bacterium]|nr:hypothetical protein [Candidatus Woesebacteria bacterium]